jgi:hypothetical protein
MKNSINDLARMWRNLHPTTRRLVKGPVPPAASPDSETKPIDSELSNLLAALDCHLAEQTPAARRRQRLQRLAENCALVLQGQTRSAEIFAQLVARAYRRHDFARLDALGAILAARFSPREICATLRHPHPIVRALGHEALVHLPLSALTLLLADSAAAPLARYALERQALDYGSEPAQEFLFFLDDNEFGVAE